MQHVTVRARIEMRDPALTGAVLSFSDHVRWVYRLRIV